MGEFLRKPILGVPAWVWAAVIGGGILAYAYISRQGDDGYSVAPAADPYPSDTDAGDAGDIEGVPNIPQKSVPVTTNPAWIRYVTDRLVASGEDPVVVTNALTKVLAGLEVTKQEAAMYATAVRLYGAPPEGAPPIVIVTAPDNPPDNNPPPSNGGSAPILPPPTNLRQPPYSNPRVNPAAGWTFAVEIHWDQPNGAVKSYDLRDFPGTGPGWFYNTGVANGGIMRYGLIHNGTYWIQIRTVNADGKAGDWSAPVAFYTKN